jgi:thiamine biosynthesis lipoprotein
MSRPVDDTDTLREAAGPWTRPLGRREFLAFGAGAFAIAGLPFAIERRRGHPGAVRRTLPVMGTIADFAVVHRDPREAHAAIDAAFADLQWVERTMTRFTDTSDIGRANLLAARDGVPVTPETALVTAEALRWADATRGAFDPAVGDVVRLWDVTHRHEPPPADRVARLMGRQLHRSVEVGTWRGRRALRYHDPDANLDLGAIAKGYGVDRAVDVLRRRGITRAVVDVGGDLYALGPGPDGEPRRIGIQDPDDDRRMAGELRVADAAVATSGTYIQYFRWRGRRYHHLMDPMTAAPRLTSVQSFTIRADTCMHADVAATALYGMAPGDADAVLARVAPGARVEAVL